MDPVVHFTLSEAWTVFLAICGGITAAAAATAVIIKVVKFLRRPNDRQNSEIAELRREVQAVKKEQERMKHEYETYFKNDNERLDKIEEGNRVMQKALLALLKHGLDGNDIEAMKKAETDMEEYLVGK